MDPLADTRNMDAHLSARLTWCFAVALIAALGLWPRAVTATGLAPDLVVSRLDQPASTVAAGRALRLTFEVTNAGAGQAKASTTRFLLSRDRRRGRGDELLPGTRSIRSLYSNASLIAAARVTLPRDARAGAWYVLACVDDLERVVEASEHNNCLASTRRIRVTSAR